MSGLHREQDFQLRGIPGDTLVWPSQLSKLDPLLLAANKKKLLSSGLTDSLLVRVRSVLLYLQQKGHPDLVLADVPRITNYWMKNTWCVRCGISWCS
jgi:hypothetical protein